MNLHRKGFLVVALLLTVAGPRVEGQDKAYAEPRCRVVPLPGHRVAFQYEGREVLAWHYGEEYPRPFFYPLRSPAGTVLTRMGHPGAPDHDHHRSVWFAHAKVEGVNFWGDEASDPGTVRQKQWLAYEDGEKEAVMAVLLGWFDGEGCELMEQEVVAAWRPGGKSGHELELQLTFRATEESVELQRTNFGFLAIRMAKELSGHFGRGGLRDSNGRRGEKEIFGQRAAWMDYSGPTAAVPDGREGVVCFDHPDNPRYPTRWHVREDGWMGASYCFTEGEVLQGEKPLVLRYLLLAHSGDNGEREFGTVGREFGKRPGFAVRKSMRPHRHYEVIRILPPQD